MQDVPTVFLIDDDVDFSSSIAKLVSTVGLRTVTYDSAASFLKEFDSESAGCVIVDLDRPELGGMQVIDKLAKMKFPHPVIAMTHEAEVASIVRAARSGTVAFLQKNLVSNAEIIDSIQLALSHDTKRRATKSRLIDLQNRFATLNIGERQVLELLLLGDEIPVIAEKLKVNRRTVDHRRARLMLKLDVKTFPALVAIVEEYRKLTPAT